MLLLLLTATAMGQTRSVGSDNLNSMMPSAGTFSVTIGGTFIVNGTFPAMPFERVDQFVTRIFNQYKVQMVSDVNTKDTRKAEETAQKAENFSRRNILLKRSDGEEMTLDLEKFRMTGDFKDNPYLKNDDVLIFSPLDIARDFISIDGAVNHPVKFPFVEGDRLSDALLFAQGINKAYENVTKAEIMRSNYSGTKDETIIVDLKSDVPLKRADRIRVLADETNRKDYRVLVLGEVSQPGYIPITRDNTTIKDVIKKAGGFKPTASLFNAEIVRGSDSYTLFKKDMLTKSFEQNKLSNEKIEKALDDNIEMEKLMMGRMSYLTEEDTGSFKIDDQLRLLRGNGLIDFTKLETDTTQGNFVVKDGDVVLIPEQEKLVYIYGQISSPGYLTYEPGKDVSYYVRQAGGLGELARSFDDISVIKAKTRKWVPVTDESLKVEPGDYIWVPKKVPRTFAWYFDRYMTRVAAVASVVSTIVTIILLSRQAK
ncbi:MAG TPA: SLBB domain-containing protein [Ignavibacteriales bacterium]|nr:SLBB domain-containing protein [Ignavibacteriales bacterium]